jgi:hypothetical protein
LDELSWAATNGALIKITPAASRTSRYCLSMETFLSKRSFYIYEWDYEPEVAGENRILTIFA